MFVFYIVIAGLYGYGVASVTTDDPHTVTRAGYDVDMTMNPANVSYLYYVWMNGSEAVRLLVVVPKPHRVAILNSSHTGYTTRIRYTGEDSLSQTGQLTFTIYNVTVQDAGTYYCQGNNKQIIPGCRQVLVLSQKPTTPIITGPPSAVSGANVTLTCSSSSRSLPPDHPPLNMTYTWRRKRTLLESGDGSHADGDDLTITNISRENQGDIYTCQAVEEGLESDWSHGHVLDVQHGPREVQFNDNRDSVSAVEGDPLTVRCSADCHPACTVTWWDTSRQRVITGQREAVLYIPAVDRSVSGEYTCHVNNTHGTAYRNLTRDVLDGVESVPILVYVVPSVLVVLAAVALVVHLIRRYRIMREKQNLRYAAYLTVVKNRASSARGESPYAAVHEEDARSYNRSSMSTVTADYEDLQAEESFHIYTALYPPLRNHNRCRVM